MVYEAARSERFGQSGLGWAGQRAGWDGEPDKKV